MNNILVEQNARFSHLLDADYIENINNDYIRVHFKNKEASIDKKVARKYLVELIEKMLEIRKRSEYNLNNLYSGLYGKSKEDANFIVNLWGRMAAFRNKNIEKFIELGILKRQEVDEILTGVPTLNELYLKTKIPVFLVMMHDINEDGTIIDLYNKGQITMETLRRLGYFVYNGKIITDLDVEDKLLYTTHIIDKENQKVYIKLIEDKEPLEMTFEETKKLYTELFNNIQAQKIDIINHLQKPNKKLTNEEIELLAILASIRNSYQIKSYISIGIIDEEQISKLVKGIPEFDKLYTITKNPIFLECLKEFNDTDGLLKLFFKGDISEETLNSINPELYSKENIEQTIINIQNMYSKGDLSAKDVIKLCQRKMLSINEMQEILQEGELEKALKDKKLLNGFDKLSILRIYLRTYAISNKEIEKLLNKEDISSMLDKMLILTATENLNKNELILGLKRLPKTMRPDSDKIFEFFDVYPENKKNGYLTGKDILELVKAGLVEDKRLIDVYNRQSVIKSSSIFPEVFKDEIVQDEEYLEYFNIEKMLIMLRNEEIRDKFTKFYREILNNQNKKDKKRTEFQKNLINEYIEDIKKNPEVDVEGDLVCLFNKGIIGIDAILPYLKQEKLMDMYINEEISIDKMTECYFKGIISESVYNKVISRNDMKRYYEEGDIRAKTIIEAYADGKLTIEDIEKICADNMIPIIEEIEKKLNNRGKKNNDENENIIKEKSEEQTIEVEKEQENENKKTYKTKRSIYIKGLEEMYIKGLIGYDQLVKLKEEGTIEEDEFKDILEAVDKERLVEELKTLGEIINSGVAAKFGEGPSKGGKPGKKGCLISQEARNEFLDEFAKHDKESITVKVREKALNGYMLIALPNMRLAILENPKEGATYIGDIYKVRELAERGNKADLRIEKKITVVNHVENWGENLLKAGKRIQNQILRDKREEIVYVKTTERDEGLQQKIEEIRKNYRENKKVRDEQE